MIKKLSRIHTSREWIPNTIQKWDTKYFIAFITVRAGFTLQEYLLSIKDKSLRPYYWNIARPVAETAETANHVPLTLRYNVHDLHVSGAHMINVPLKMFSWNHVSNLILLDCVSVRRKTLAKTINNLNRNKIAKKYVYYTKRHSLCTRIKFSSAPLCFTVPQNKSNASNKRQCILALIMRNIN